MKPLFDRNCNLVAWIYLNEHIFDLHLNWVAYIANNHIWSSSSDKWLGPIDGNNCYDKKGKPIAWDPDNSPFGNILVTKPLAPLRPLTPLAPKHPLKSPQPLSPLTPRGGWSNLCWDEWLNQ